LTDGECMERLWSYLRKYANITKSMSYGHRIDALSDALLHYTFRMKNKLSIRIVTINLCLYILYLGVFGVSTLLVIFHSR